MYTFILRQANHLLFINCFVSGFHRCLNAAVGTRRPNIWLFIVHQKDMQATAEIELEAARRGDPTARRRRKWRLLEQRFVEAKRDLENGVLDLNHFLRRTTYLIRHFT